MELSEIEENQLHIDIVDIKKEILSMIFKAQSGHPGGSLSCSTIIYLLYSKVMNIDVNNPKWEGRDYFILSKGHAAPALYAVLSKIGYIKSEEIKILRKLGSPLQGHPVKNGEMGIEVSTGSLGMGLSIGLGCALSFKVNKKENRVYTLLGDGELNEGVVWEAAMAASHYKTDNLIATIDRNGIQSDGSTEEIMALEPLGEKWRAFGWNVIEVDGSNIKELLNAFEKAKRSIGRPSVIISYLIKGADISFMEHTRKFHGRPPNNEEFNQAMRELDKIEIELRG